jgi:hypothetical protein
MMENDDAADQIHLRFIRYTNAPDGVAAPLTVEYVVRWIDAALTPADFDPASRPKLPSAGVRGTLEIPAGETQAALDLTAIADTPVDANGIERLEVHVVSTSAYAVVLDSTALDDIKPKDNADSFAFVKVQVLDGITLFADGRPGGADGSDVDVNDIRQGGFGQINSGGSARAPWKLLTGRDGRRDDVAGWSNADISALIQLELTTNGKRLFIASKSDAPNIVPKHAFSIVGRNDTNDGWILLNPWGTTPPPEVLDNMLSANIDWIEIVDP